MPTAATSADLGDLLTAAAREAALRAGDRGLIFFYDYRGPALTLQDAGPEVQRVAHALLQDALQRLSSGCIFFSVDVIPHHPDRATVLLQVADTGRPASDMVVNRLLTAGRPAPTGKKAAVPATPPREDNTVREARLTCERLGGSLIVGHMPNEGHIARADVLVACSGPLDDVTVGIEQGLVAWLVGEPVVIFEALVRRLHRLGWKVLVIPNAQLAEVRLQEGVAGHAPDLVIGNAQGQDDIVVLDRLATRLPSRTAVLAGMTRHGDVQADAFGFIGRVKLIAAPMSPAELYQLTVCALAKNDRRFRAPTAMTVSLERRPRALLVEDNLINQLLSTEILQMFGFEVDVANNGLEAVQHCLRELPAIILMDVDMPVMDGLEATRQIRALKERGTLPHIPIIATTARTSDPERREAHEAGMDGFIAKPLDIELMQQEIRRVLEATGTENATP